MCDSSSDRNDDRICRDYLRFVCNRGKKCKFVHPQRETGVTSSSSHQERSKFTEYFCHDFQNTECVRGDDCKFLHCTKEEQDGFMINGCLAPPLVEEAISKSITPCLPTETPVCREYLSGECRRGKACRFRHLSLGKYRKELDTLFGVEPLIPEPQHTPHSEPKRFKPNCGSCSRVPKNSCQPVVRSCNQNYVTHECSDHIQTQRHRPVCQMVPPPYQPEGCYEQIQLPQESFLAGSLQEENVVLKKQVFDLKRQLLDLMTANEFLLDQNATLRLLRKNDGMVTMHQPTATALSVQSAPGASMVASAVPVSIAPVSGSGLPLSTMAIANATTTQQLVSVSCHAPGQQIMPVTVAGQTGQQIMSVAGQTGQQLVSVTGQAGQQIMSVAGQTGQQLVSVSGQAGQQIMSVAGQTGQQLVSVSGQAGQQIMSVAGQTGQQLVSVTGQAGQQIMSGRQTILAPVSVSSSASQLMPVSVSMPVSLTTVSMAPVHSLPPHIVTSLPSTDASRSMAMNVSYPIVTHQALLPTH